MFTALLKPDQRGRLHNARAGLHVEKWTMQTPRIDIPISTIYDCFDVSSTRVMRAAARRCIDSVLELRHFVSAMAELDKVAALRVLRVPCHTLLIPERISSFKPRVNSDQMRCVLQRAYNVAISYGELSEKALSISVPCLWVALASEAPMIFRMTADEVAAKLRLLLPTNLLDRVDRWKDKPPFSDLVLDSWEAARELSGDARKQQMEALAVLVDHLPPSRST